MNIPVSVIVCAHDEEQNLRELLPLLLAQNHPEFEIIIVEDRCNDGTYDFLLEQTNKYARLKMVHVTNKPEHINGKKYALTLGIKAARYDWVLLTDADCRPDSTEWIRQMAGSFTDTNFITIGFSPYLSEPGLLNSFIRFETIITAIQYFSFALIGMPYMGVGRNLAYRKRLFLDNKGFGNYNSLMGGDDDLFVNQHAKSGNTHVVLTQNSLMFSKPKTTWKEFKHQKSRHLMVGKYYKLKHKIFLGFFAISWVLFWPVMLVLIFSTYWQLGLAAIGLRWLGEMMAVNQFSKKAGVTFEILKIPILDFIFSFYYLVTGYNAWATKRIKWKT